MKEDQEPSGGSLVPSASSALTRKSSGLVRRGLDDLVKLSVASNSSEVDANQRELPKPRFSEAEVARQLKDMAQYLDEVEEQANRDETWKAARANDSMYQQTTFEQRKANRLALFAAYLKGGDAGLKAAMPPQYHPEAPNVVPPVTPPQEERFVPSGTTPAGSSHQSENPESSKRSSEEWIASLRKNFLKRLKEQRSVQVMSDADDEEVGLNDVEREELAEAREVIRAFGRFLSESQPIISDAQLLPYPKSKIAQSHLLYERYLCDFANEYVASQDVERLKEIDQTLGPLRTCRGILASYSNIEPKDMEDVSYFNSFKSIKDVPKDEADRCFDLKMKYASKGMKETVADES